MIKLRALLMVGLLAFTATGFRGAEAAGNRGITCAEWSSRDPYFVFAFTSGWMLYHVQSHEWTTTMSTKDAYQHVKTICALSPTEHYSVAYQSLAALLLARHNEGNDR